MESAELTASYQCVLRFFPLRLCKALRQPRNLWSQVIRSAAPVAQNHFSKPQDLMLQNAFPLRKSALYNTSNSCVSCTAPATRNAPANAFETATKPSRFAHFWHGAQRLAPATRNDMWTSKNGPSMWCFWHFDLDICHNGVHFFDISTSKSAPGMVCILHFDLETCFAPQRCALFHLTLLTLKCGSRHSSLHFFDTQLPKVLRAWCVCTFWLRHALRATSACTFSSLIWPDGSAPAALASLLFDPPESQISGKTRWIATLLPFRAPAFFFPLTLSLLWSSFFFSSLLFSSLLFSSLTLPTSALPSANIVRSLISKLPSTIIKL